MLVGTYVYPEVLSESMVSMLQMLGEVYVGVKDRMVDTVITLQDYTQYWKYCRGKTSTSICVLHFGHWKVAESNNKVAELRAMLTHMLFQ